ncbi:MAG: flippase-like domain-containing protein [Candidatus Magnetoovum sp. WYHC-5]|nr:flippase-like domain-containing protein [Candidatus Magnetoovum sp. WYHC-5]
MKYIEFALFFTGLAVVIYLISATGVERLSADVSMIGVWGFILVLSQEILSHMANTIGWIYTIRPDKRTVTFRELFMYRLAGEGINYLTPTATIGGEFVKIRLAARKLGVEEGTASITLAKFAETNGQVIFIILGLALILPFLPGLSQYRWWMFAAVLMAISVVVLLLMMLRYGFYTIAVKVLSQLKFTKKWFLEHKEKIHNIDKRIKEHTKERFTDLIYSIIWYTIAFATSVIEVWIILYFLGLQTNWLMLFGVEVLSVLIEAILFFVPMKMGTQEGGKMLIFKILSMDPVKGLAMGVIRRARELFWATLGLVFYVALKAYNK